MARHASLTRIQEVRKQLALLSNEAQIMRTAICSDPGFTMSTLDVSRLADFIVDKVSAIRLSLGIE